MRDFEEHLLEQSRPPYKLDKRKILADLLGYCDVSLVIDELNQLPEADREQIKKFLK